MLSLFCCGAKRIHSKVGTKSSDAPNSRDNTADQPTSGSFEDIKVPGYTGALKGEHRHGYGNQNYADGLTCEGDWQDNMRHGRGMMQFNNGSEYSGEWYNDKWHGVGTYIWPNGAEYSGGWKQGLRHGKGKYTTAHGSVFVGDFVDDYAARGNVLYANGNHFNGDVKHDRGVLKHHGKGKMVFANKDEYEGDWERNKMHGHGMYIFANGNILEGVWLEGTFKLAKGHACDQDEEYSCLPVPVEIVDDESLNGDQTIGGTEACKVLEYLGTEGKELHSTKGAHQSVLSRKLAKQH